MLKGLLGRKLGMTRIFTEEGLWIDVTLVETGPCTVVQRKTKDHDGYEAVQVGYGEVAEKRCTKPMLGHYKSAGVTPRRVLKEFRVDAASGLKPGDEISGQDIFKTGDRVDICGVSKGKGFQGVMKRHGFGGGPGGHGSMFHRAPGSIGGSSYPSRVWPGMRMGGHMGAEQVTVRNLEIAKVDAENNLLLIKGAVPGPKGGYVVIKQEA